MRLVKCKDTGKIGTPSDFYKADDGKYYESKERYEKIKRENEYYFKILQFINNDLLKKTKDMFNSTISACTKKCINEIGLSSDVVYAELLKNKDYLLEHIDNYNTSDASKINYIFSIALGTYKNTTYAGCYEIRNLETNEIYIGESIDLFGRFTTHVSELYNNTHHCIELQKSFNIKKDISNFKITPLFIFPILKGDKNELKHETLYLECASYLVSKYDKISLFNTVNPYLELKNNSVSLKGYNIDCKKVLRLLLEDKYSILPKKLLKAIESDLKNIGLFLSDRKSSFHTKDLNVEKENKSKSKTKKTLPDNIDEITGIDNIISKIEYTKTLVTNGEKLYRITHLLKDFVEDGLLPNDYDYSKIRTIMMENNLITVDSLGHTVATKYSLDNNLYFINRVSIKDNVPIYDYYLSDKCKKMLMDLFLKYYDFKEYKSAS